MSARESIENLWDRATPVAPLLDQLLAEHAHELAEKIRTDLAERVKERLAGGVFEIRTVSTAQHAADLIDPEVLNSGN